MNNPYKETLLQANKLLRTTDHLAYVTYPFLQEYKLLITITENLYNSIITLITAFLQFEAYFGRIQYTPIDINDKLQVFKEHCARRYNIEEKQLKVIQDLHNIKAERKSSIMEFNRNNKYMIYSNSGLKSISIGLLKEYINETKNLTRKVNLIIQNDR
ncbi:hypothetical protein CL617_01825 [archaeon]|jgi:hypothetical protein|nr:hypothetical protein [archaeon]|tara:strand:- start:14122 stop:14595 length:474 start_codon:yes stop_codon:yes gene_type:complete